MELSDTMIALMSPSKAQRLIAENIREHRLQRNLTQQELSSRSGVPLSTLRKFEQQGVLSLESLLKILMVLGMLDTVVNATKIEEIPFTSIDEVVALNAVPKRKRARSK